MGVTCNVGWRGDVMQTGPVHSRVWTFMWWGGGAAVTLQQVQIPDSISLVQLGVVSDEGE